MRTFIARRSVKIGGAIAAVVILLGAAIGGFILSRAKAATPYLPPLLYATNGQGRLYALNTWSHQVAWVQNGMNGHYFSGTPVLYDGNVYVGFNDGTIYAFTERT